MTQNDMILNHIKQFGSIAPLESLRLYGVMRLASRIRELREQGFDIATFMIDDGEKRYAKYVLNNENKY